MFRRLLFAALLVLVCTVQPARAAYQPVCTPRTYTFSYTDNALKVASATATKTLLTLPAASVKLCLASMRVQTAFTGSTIVTGTVTTTSTGTATATSTAAYGTGQPKCTLGSGTSVNSAIYLGSPTPLSMAQTSQTQSQGGVFSGSDLTTPDGNLAVVLTCTTGGGNWGTGSATDLTAGKLWITLGTMTLPAGQ